MTKKYRILIINWQDINNPLSGGAEVHLFEIFKRMSQSFEFHLLCSNFPGGLGEVVLDGINIHRVGTRNTFNFFVPRAFSELDRRYDFDFVIEDLNKIPFFGRFYIEKKRLAIIHHLFGNVIFRETNPIFGFYVYLAERLVPHFYHDVPFISVSESTKEELVRMGLPGENIKVIYNGVDIKRYEPGEKSRIPLIVGLGRLKKYKGFEVFLKAIGLLRSKGKKFSAIIIGGGDELTRLKKIAERLRIRDILTFTGFVPEKKKAELLKKAWACVNTSPKEGWGLTSMEAQASGTLSIVPDSPGLRETVINGKTGFIYPFGNSERLTDQILKIIGNPKLAERMGIYARQWAENFTWDRFSKETEDFIIRNIAYTFSPERKLKTTP